MWNTFTIIFEISLLSNSNICVSFGLVDCLIILIMCPIFLPLCMLGNILLTARHCEFNFVGCWVFMHVYKLSWVLFWDPAKLLGNCLILTGLAYIIFLVYLIIPYYWGNSFLNSLLNDLFFQSGWWEQAIFPALCKHQKPFPLILSAGSLPGFS